MITLLAQVAIEKDDRTEREKKSLSLTETGIAITTGFFEMSSLLGLFERDNKIVMNVVFLVLVLFFRLKLTSSVGSCSGCRRFALLRDKRERKRDNANLFCSGHKGDEAKKTEDASKEKKLTKKKTEPGTRIKSWRSKILPRCLFSFTLSLQLVVFIEVLVTAYCYGTRNIVVNYGVWDVYSSVVLPITICSLENIPPYLSPGA